MIEDEQRRTTPSLAVRVKMAYRGTPVRAVPFLTTASQEILSLGFKSVSEPNRLGDAWSEFLPP